MAWSRLRRWSASEPLKRNPFDNPDMPCPLTDDQVKTLALYNSQRLEGLVHTEKWQAKMARLQQQYDDWTQACIHASGGEIYRPGERPLHTE
jgi:hypothetical protein